MKKTMLLAGLVVVLMAGCDNKPAIPPMPSRPIIPGPMPYPPMCPGP